MSMSLVRSVLMEGLVYRTHVVTAINHSLEGGRTVVEVRSAQVEGGSAITHWYDGPLRVGMTEAEAVQWLGELPAFVEYEDPAGAVAADAEAERDDALSRLGEALRILTPEQAEQVIDAFPAWRVGVRYEEGTRVRHGGAIYRCVQAHTSQADWHPDAVPALWVPLQAEGGDDDPTTIPVWVQPTGAQDAYTTGDRVWYPDASGQVWESTMDGNVWAPDAYPAGWQPVG